MNTFDKLKTEAQTIITKEETQAKGFWTANRRVIIGVLIAILVGFVAGKVLAQTITVPAPKCTAVTTITCQSQTVSLPSAPAQTPPVVSLPVGVTWMYQGGQKTAWGDFSGSTTNWAYKTSSGLNGATTDIRVSGGCFIPVWASNYQYPNPGYSYFLISVKPSSSNPIGIHFEPRIGGDADIYPHITLTDPKYGPAPQAGVWASYKIPLADLGVPPGTPLYKAVLACDGGTYEFDSIGFQ